MKVEVFCVMRNMGEGIGLESIKGSLKHARDEVLKIIEDEYEDENENFIEDDEDKDEDENFIEKEHGDGSIIWERYGEMELMIRKYEVEIDE